jgi:hypothetical protein
MLPAWLVTFGRTVAAVVLNTAAGAQAQQLGDASGTVAAAGNIVNPLPGGSLIGDTSYEDSGSESIITFNADGTISGFYNFNQDFSGEWYDGTPDQTYQVRATISSESGNGTKTGTFGSWLSFPQSWSARKSGSTGDKTLVINFQIRRASDSVTVSNGVNDYTLYAANEQV